MMKPPVPVPILRNLRCGHCKKYVTCGPVHVTPNSGVLCGRCGQYAKEEYRNFAFEAVASLFRYPCHYWPKHCNKKLVWNEALDHEGKCLFQSSCNVFCSRPGTFFKSDRKLTNTTEITLEHVTDEALQHLKCANCECYLSNSPVYILAEGKNLCHRCIHTNGYPKGSIQNLAYETLASGLIFPCIYRFRGCTYRGKFGRDMWAHESECPYGQLKKQQKKTSRVIKNGIEKERGVIQTHSGHIYATITQHSIVGAYPQAGTSGGKVVTSELEHALNKKKQLDDKPFDSQSMDSVMSKSTLDSLGDNLSRSLADNVSRDNVSRTTIDNISRSTADNISRDNISRDNVSRASSRAKDDYRRSWRSNEAVMNDDPKFLDRPGSYRQNMLYSGEVSPQPTPPGYIKSHHYYHENVGRYGPQFEPGFQYPPNPNYRPSLHYSPSFSNPNLSQVQPKRSESFRVGNPVLINELKELQKRQSVAPKEDNLFKDCSNVQELVQKHDEVFH